LFTEGRFDEAKELHWRISRLNQAVSGVWGVAGVKAAMDIIGFRGGRPREPLSAVTGDDARRIQQQMVDEGFMSE
jgi:4-hydroxy-2-oxoglutarate aldolase